MQYWVTIVVLLVAVGYAARRVYGVLKGKTDPCEGCALKKNCKKFGKSKEM